MRIDVFTDLVCPFCQIGMARLNEALDATGIEAEIHHHSFELDPTLPKEPTQPLVDAIAAKYNMSHEQSVASQEQIAAQLAAVGVTFDWRNAVFTNTFDAHRLLHLAAAHGQAEPVREDLMRAYLERGLSISDPQVLRDIAAAHGLPTAEVESLLAGDDFADQVRDDERTAQAMGIQGVPFMVFDQRLAVSGAQPVDVFISALQQAANQ
ncbi:DsbA family oxidoreductase [Corynebacterium sp. 13CS0277]|uniref:DsbA family oxidoreductase n=1 Tax=Corynebacterium sp. 13CS0277 TaxID=2071994 RepID=UPI000D0244FF|nr:DsbA family oxidoreductase [Corynebacterium sp. 13CS0277]PRQ11834.1 DsbA family oxidoreductase [Corynebacterium sp. 13CS0277]